MQVYLSLLGTNAVTANNKYDDEEEEANNNPGKSNRDLNKMSNRISF
jgi:hypothetical protein